MRFHTVKPWYKRRRFWTFVFLAVLFYFCFVPSPLKISPESTGFTEPLLPNGEVDYFGAYEKLYIHKLSPPEDNGYRLLLAACGPRILEQQYLMDQISSWDELPTHERSKQWFHEKWVPLCEHMYIDPYAKPRFHDSFGFHEFLYQERKAKQEDAKRWETAKEDDELWDQLVAAPWTAEDHPDIARWLEERSPVLDLFGVAVRKPNFACYRWREETMWSILFPDAQGSREFARDLRVRITERLGKGDIDGAWHDVMSLFILSRKHYLFDPFVTVNLVGIAAEGMGRESAMLVLQYGNASPEQLAQFANDLTSLPRKIVLDTTAFEELFTFGSLKDIHKYMLVVFGINIFLDDEEKNTLLSFINPFRWIDYNIAGKRLEKRFNAVRQMRDDSAWNINRTVMKKHVDLCAPPDESWCFNCMLRDTRAPWDLLRVPLIHTRSQLLADVCFNLMVSCSYESQNALDRSNAQLDLLRLAVALERYKSANEKYPATLDELVPVFLEEVPLDAFTGRKTLMYKLAPNMETAFLLYSYGMNEADDGGAEDDVVLRR